MPEPSAAARPIPDDLLPWAATAWGREAAACTLSPVAGDASNRRYFRLHAGVAEGAAKGAASVIVLDAPPATEKNAAFLAVRQLLADGGVRVPGLLAADLERGFLLLEDLGAQMLLPLLSPQSAEAWYARASALLLDMSGIDAAAAVPPYDHALLTEELGRLPQWFFGELLGLAPTKAARASFEALAAVLIDSALAQPRVLVHRDFHSRNLMVLPGQALAVIDFQDAVFGPVTYDIVALLRDCYIRWPQAQVQAWALAHRDALQQAGRIEPVSDATFLRWFDLMGLQRHLKVLGTFARLYLRDGKAAYLEDLPRVIAYVEAVLAGRRDTEPALGRFHDCWRAEVRPVINCQPWMRAGSGPA
ncbi:aminoglycoside phosphotransferase family protein [Parahaliea mediterranea]|uniref:aminoglycoside phosphotransferase family protein n=1 Tax=Parahaliea mediterranea TaxID=651086 RepID=UPI001F4E085F|nr:phosphotransferase [Parahaliea mediterranea]